MVNQSVDGIKWRVKELLADISGQLRPADIPDDWPLFDAPFDGMEIDSLDSLKLAMALADEYDLDPETEFDYSRVQTVSEIARYVQSLIPTGGRV